VIQSAPVPQGPLHVLIDSTGLQVYGAGQWVEAKYGTKSRRKWRKLHLQAERAALEQQWRQRLERAQYKGDQARRRYASTEPENRLVARTLERDWEEALAEQVRLTAGTINCIRISGT